MFTYTPQDKIITKFIKNDPIQKFNLQVVGPLLKNKGA